MSALSSSRTRVECPTDLLLPPASSSSVSMARETPDLSYGNKNDRRSMRVRRKKSSGLLQYLSPQRVAFLSAFVSALLASTPRSEALLASPVCSRAMVLSGVIPCQQSLPLRRGQPASVAVDRRDELRPLVGASSCSMKTTSAFRGVRSPSSLAGRSCSSSSSRSRFCSVTKMSGTSTGSAGEGEGAGEDSGLVEEGDHEQEQQQPQQQGDVVVEGVAVRSTQHEGGGGGANVAIVDSGAETK